MKPLARVAAVLVALGASAGLLAEPALAVVINFGAASVPGNGSFFIGAGNAQDVTITAGGFDVVLSGGVMLGPGILFLPADSGVAYGTADFANSAGQSGYLNTLTIQFFDAGTSSPANVNNFFIDVFNGNTVPIDYTLADNLGASFAFNIADNLSSGRRTFGILTAGHTMTITATLIDPDDSGACFCAWDFFINNIGFNEALPPGSNVPEPAARLLLALAPIPIALRRWLRKRPA